MDIYKHEIFGPVLSTVRAKTYEEALGLAMDHEMGNGTAIFTRDGDAARDFANRVNVGMIGINVPIPVPLAYHTFGGWKKSVFGDLNQHGPDAFKFYTRTKTVTSRWPSGIKEGGEFSIPVMVQADGVSDAPTLTAGASALPATCLQPLYGQRYNLTHVQLTILGGITAMDFALSEEQTAIFDMAYGFGQEHIAPFAQQWEKEDHPKRALAQDCRVGLWRALCVRGCGRLWPDTP